MNNNGKLCPCGNPSLEDDHLCSRCRYYANVFNPRLPEFESKIERAQAAIRVKKMMKGTVKMVEME